MENQKRLFLAVDFHKSLVKFRRVERLQNLVCVHSPKFRATRKPVYGQFRLTSGQPL